MEKQLRATRGVYRSILAEKVLRPILPNARDRSLFVTNLLATAKSNKAAGAKAGCEREER